MRLTNRQLMEILRNQPLDAIIMIEDSTGAVSQTIGYEDVHCFERDNDNMDGMENVVFLSTYKE